MDELTKAENRELDISVSEADLRFVAEELLKTGGDVDAISKILNKSAPTPGLARDVLFDPKSHPILLEYCIFPSQGRLFIPFNITDDEVFFRESEWVETMTGFVTFFDPVARTREELLKNGSKGMLDKLVAKNLSCLGPASCQIPEEHFNSLTN